MFSIKGTFLIKARNFHTDFIMDNGHFIVFANLLQLILGFFIIPNNNNNYYYYLKSSPLNVCIFGSINSQAFSKLLNAGAIKKLAKTH